MTEDVGGRCAVVLFALGSLGGKASGCIPDGDASTMPRNIVDEGERLEANRLGPGLQKHLVRSTHMHHGLFVSLPAASSLLSGAVASCITKHSVLHPPGDPVSSRQ
jgi:hypothetical protein